MNLHELTLQAVDDTHKWFPTQADQPFFIAACLAGEVGEVLNLLKKVERGTHPYDEAMAEEVFGEVADVFTYLLVLAGQLGIDLEMAYAEKRTYNKTRYDARQALEGPKR